MGHIFLLLVCAVAFVITTVISWKTYYFFVSGYENWTTSRGRHLYQRSMISVSSGVSVAYLIYILGSGGHATNDLPKTEVPPQPTIVQNEVNPVTTAEPPPANPLPETQIVNHSPMGTETSQTTPLKSNSAQLNVVPTTQAIAPVVLTDRNDCPSRPTFIEKRICEDDTLASENDQMQVAFRDALIRIGGSTSVGIEQQRWFQTMLTNCYDEQCAEKAIQERTYELRKRYLGK